jgi:hypothetical protein
MTSLTSTPCPAVAVFADPVLVDAVRTGVYWNPAERAWHRPTGPYGPGMNEQLNPASSETSPAVAHLAESAGPGATSGAFAILD